MFGAIRRPIGIATVLIGVAMAKHAFAAKLISCPDAAAIIKAEMVTNLRSVGQKKRFAELVAAHSKAPAIQTAVLHEAPPAASPNRSKCTLRSVTVRPGDDAYGLARRYMGDGTAWPRIVAANPQLHGSHILIVGSQLRIPCSGKVAGGTIGAATRAALHIVPDAGGAKAPTMQTPNAKPAAPSLPVWRARGGQYLTTVVREWAKKAGYRVIIATNADWKLAVPVAVQADFSGALKILVAGFDDSGAPPFIQMFPNKVLKIGGGM
ncbi:TcpQ domain-containing protein [Solirhodobacter olei]|uniref:TcpQ domain-containing protein n=1 Tax=Solirhodobacter olei TaxID=2493082 RepID=UPI000FD8F562|nr:TcpQ domain-containing protein [Solirhodobacter olei]